MSSFQEQLRQINWKRLSHAYGAATDTPGHLQALLAQDIQQREQALDQL